MAPSSISATTITLNNASGNGVSATVSYNPASLTAVLTPAAPLALATTYKATVKGGVGGVTDLAGNALPSNFLWSFTTINQYATNIWPSTAVPGVADAGPDNSIEVGVQFRLAVAGSIAGIRFYKAAANTGTHIGNLWTSNGTNLATATFTGETASGWQQVLFTKPVAITPNTLYVASYHAKNGHYSADENYFSIRALIIIRCMRWGWMNTGTAACGATASIATEQAAPFPIRPTKEKTFGWTWSLRQPAPSVGGHDPQEE